MMPSRGRMPSRGAGRAPGRATARLVIAAILVAALSAVACGHHDEPAADAEPKGEASSSSADAPASGAATIPADETAGAVRIDPNPSAPSAAPAGTAPGGAVPAAAAPGTLSLRFIVRKHETKEELAAGSFEVRLLPLDPIREGTASGASAGETGTRAGVTTEAPRPGQGVPIGPAAASGPASGATYQGSPEQVLVTQLDGSKRTFLAGVKPGTYAMRITAKGRRMLLEVLTVKAEDRLVERTLEAERLILPEGTR